MIVSLLALLACAPKSDLVDTDGDTVDTGLADGGGSELPLDEDGDGWTADQDCDDLEPAVYPGAAELCNGRDDDCDEAVDEDALDPTAWYLDADGDGFGDPSYLVMACEPPPEHAASAEDCDDGDADINPAMAEICDDRLDNDCDGTADGCLRSGSYDVSELAATVWRADDPGCLEQIAAGSLSVCSLLGGVVAGPDIDLDGDGGPDFLVHSSWRSANLVVPLDSDSGSWEEGATAELSYANVPSGTDGCDGLTSRCSGFIGARVVGDWNGDSYQDTAVISVFGYRDGGDWRDSNVLAMSLGPFRGEVDVAADAILLVGVDGEGFGGTSGESGDRGLATVGDTNGDGMVDLVVGASSGDSAGIGGHSSAGRAYLFTSPIESSQDVERDAAAIWFASADGNDRSLGAHVASVGDTNGDGLDEAIIFASDRFDDRPRQAWVVSTSDRGSMPIDDVAEAVLLGDQTRIVSTWSPMSTQQDFDGDGRDDLVIADYKSSVSGVDFSGAVYIVAGPLRGEIDLFSVAWARFDGDEPYCYFGWEVDAGAMVEADRPTLTVSGIGRSSASPEVCVTPARTVAWYTPEAGTWAESTADLHIDMVIGWETEPDGRAQPSDLGHVTLAGSTHLLMGMGSAGDKPDGEADHGFIALVPLPGL